MIKILFIFFIFINLLYANIFTTNIAPSSFGSSNKKIKILDQKILNIKNINRLKFAGISDVAYSKKSQKLYLVSDFGDLFTFKAIFSKNNIQKLTPLKGVNLVQKNGRKFRTWLRNSEGLALDNRGRCYVSFEGRAKICRFNFNGRMITKYRLPYRLRSTKNYRSSNKSLEALAWHSRYGLLTASEWPLKQYPKKTHTIYSLRGKKWHFKAEPEKNSGVVAIEVMDDGNLLVLERSYITIFKPFIVTLKKVYIKNCRKKICKSEVLLKMNNHKGWLIDNFEGLAKVGKNRFVIISDDNDNFFQQTILIYFQIL